MCLRRGRYRQGAPAAACSSRAELRAQPMHSHQCHCKGGLGSGCACASKPSRVAPRPVGACLRMEVSALGLPGDRHACAGTLPESVLAGSAGWAGCLPFWAAQGIPPPRSGRIRNSPAPVQSSSYGIHMRAHRPISAAATRRGECTQGYVARQRTAPRWLGKRSSLPPRQPRRGESRPGAAAPGRGAGPGPGGAPPAPPRAESVLCRLGWKPRWPSLGAFVTQCCFSLIPWTAPTREFTKKNTPKSFKIP